MVRLALFFCLIASPLFPQAKKFVSDKPLTAASRQRPADIGKSFAAQAFTLPPEALAGVFLAKEYTDDHNGITHLHYRQRFQNIEVANADFAVHVDRDGQVVSAGGQLFNAPQSTDLTLFEAAAARKAARSAVKAVATDKQRSYFPVETQAAAHQPQGSVRYAAATLADDVEGTPIWYAVNGTLIAAWKMNVVNEAGDNSADVIVEASSGRTMAKFPTTHRQSAKGLVYEKGSPQPNPAPGSKLTAAPPVVDRTSVSFAGDPIASPAGWVIGNRTAGNNTVTGENFLGQTYLTTPRITTAPNGDFSFPLTIPFATSPVAFGDAVNTNLFYLINLAHDKFYKLGFNEAAGNFQAENYGRGGTGGDAMYAYAHYGSQAPTAASLQNAFFTTRTSADGSPSMVAMYVGTADQAPYQFTDGSLDATVVIHEYTHGVSTRLISGCYSVFQCAAMAEAWSDYFSLEFTLPANAPIDGTYPVAEYMSQVWGSGSFRTRPYSTNLAVNNLTFAALGKVIPEPEVHADGEIWAQALWEVRAALIKQYGDADGRAKANLLVIDGMKLSVPQPSMVDARDAILLADRVDYKGANQALLWTAFAKRGFGALAFTPNPDSEYVVASSEVPTGKGLLKILDAPLTAGESIRVLLNDTNLNSNGAHVVVTASSGDSEEMTLERQGSLFIGTIGGATSGTGIAKNNGLLKVVPGDAVSAYYFDADTGSGSALIQTTLSTQQPYLLRSLASFTPPAGTERRVTDVDTNLYGRITLPFDFPFFGKTYRSVIADLNGALLFDFPPFSACQDSAALALQPAIAPLWAQADFGSASDGVYFSSTANTATVRWQTITYDPFFFSGTPLNFSVTLRDDGQIFLTYGDNVNPSAAFIFPGCGRATTVGISNGRETYAPIYNLPSYNRISYNFLPPFGFSDFPTGKLEAPLADATVKDTLTITGYAADVDLLLSRVDLFIDGKAMANTTASLSRPDVCRTPAAACGGYSVQLDLAGNGITPGKHTIQARVTNARGGFADFPDKPQAFTVEALTASPVVGKVELPLAGDAVSGTLTVRGYAYAAGVRISTADVLIDGITYPGGRYGLSRADICATLTAPLPPNCPAVGFSATIDTTSTAFPVADGTHTLQVRVRDALGRFTLIPEQPVSFTVKNTAQPLPIVVATSFKQGDTMKGVVNIDGYTYQTDTARVTSAVVVIDGFIAYTAQIGLPAVEACKALPDVAACPNIGFHYALDTRTLTNGPHLIQVVVRNNRGQVAWGPVDNYNGAAVTIAN